VLAGEAQLGCQAGDVLRLVGDAAEFVVDVIVRRGGVGDAGHLAGVVIGVGDGPLQRRVIGVVPFFVQDLVMRIVIVAGDAAQTVGLLREAASAVVQVAGRVAVRVGFGGHAAQG